MEPFHLYVLNKPFVESANAISVLDNSVTAGTPTVVLKPVPIWAGVNQVITVFAST